MIKIWILNILLPILNRLHLLWAFKILQNTVNLRKKEKIKWGEKCGERGTAVNVRDSAYHGSSMPPLKILRELRMY